MSSDEENRSAREPTPHRRVLGLAAPIIGENLLETMLGIVDTVLVARVGMAAIAGVGMGQQLTFFVLSMLAALSVGSSVLVAQAVGAADLATAGRYARQSLLWSVILSVPLALGGVLLAEPILRVCGLEPEAHRIAVGFFQVTMGTVVVLVARIIAGGVLRGAGDSRTPMRVTAVANVLNIGLAYGLIYGHWGLPALGAVGSAWATFAARAVALLLILRPLWVGRGGVRLGGGGSWRPDVSVIRQVLSIGVPAAVEQLLISSAFLMLSARVAALGTDLLAAQRISMSALSFSFLPGIGFSLATTTLVGHCIGARKPAESTGVTRVATTWAVLWMSAIGAVVLLLADPIMRVFTQDPQVVRLGSAGLRVVALLQPAWAVSMVHAGALRGTGDTRFPLVVSATGTWTAVLLASFGLSWIGGNLTTVWGAFMFTSPITATLLWWRFRRRIEGLVAAESGR